jgi:hypothetical protein
MSPDAPRTALAHAQPTAMEPWRTDLWQRLWLSLQAKPWTVLAVIPASSGGPRDFAQLIAVTLARTGMVHLASPIHVADGADVTLATVVAFLEEIKHYRDAGDRILIALLPISESLVTESIAQSADFSLLCVLFESMAWGETRKTVTRIGPDRFIGSAIFHPEMLPTK